MMKLFKIAFLPLLAGILLLPAASRPVRAAGSAAVEAGAGDRKRDKKKKQEADTAAKATPYEKLFKDKRVETVRGGGLTLHLTADKLYLELPDSLLGRGLMITTTIEWTGDPGDGLAHQQPVPPYMVEFGRGKSDTLLCMREFAPVVIVDGSPAMREAVGRSNIGPIVASYAVKARTPDGKSSVVDVTALFVGDVKRLRPIDPEGGNTYGGWMTAKADYKKDRSMLTGVTGGKGCVSVVGELSYGTTVSFLGLLDLWKDKPQSIVARRTLRVLGDPERRMRLCDQRLGLAAKAFKRFSDREQEAKTDYYVCRRSILDSAGKVRPVVFYVDTAFDASAYAAVERGLLLWNDAFAKIGCKDVVRVEPFPADPAFNDNSLYNNCVRRTGTSNSELYTASWVDPRSGEILGTDIFVPFNFTAAIQKKLLLTLSAGRPRGAHHAAFGASDRRRPDGHGGPPCGLGFRRDAQLRRLVGLSDRLAPFAVVYAGKRPGGVDHRRRVLQHRRAAGRQGARCEARGRCAGSLRLSGRRVALQARSGGCDAARRGSGAAPPARLEGG